MRNCPLIFPFLVPSTTLPVAAVAILLAVVVEVRRVRASGGELPAAVAAVLYRAEVLDDAGDGLVGGAGCRRCARRAAQEASSVPMRRSTSPNRKKSRFIIPFSLSISCSTFYIRRFFRNLKYPPFRLYRLGCPNLQSPKL